MISASWGIILSHMCCGTSGPPPPQPKPPLSARWGSPSRKPRRGGGGRSGKGARTIPPPPPARKPIFRQPRGAGVCRASARRATRVPGIPTEDPALPALREAPGKQTGIKDILCEHAERAKGQRVAFLQPPSAQPAASMSGCAGASEEYVPHQSRGGGPTDRCSASAHAGTIAPGRTHPRSGCGMDVQASAIPGRGGW